MHITDVIAAVLFYIGDAAAHPIPIAQTVFLRHCFDNIFARAIERRFVIDRNNDKFFRLIVQKFEIIPNRIGWLAVNRNKIISGLDVESRSGQRAVALFIPAISDENFINPVKSAFMFACINPE
jgi:hypothetical protein